MTLQEIETAPGLETLDAAEPDPVESWAREAPLKLVAWALDSMGRTAKSTAINQKLEGDLFRNPNWKTWWGRVLPAVKQSRRFNVKTNNSITLLSNVDDIPAGPWDSLPVPVKNAKTKTASVGDWKKWLLSDVLEPPPGARPTKPVCNALAKLSKKDIRPALHRTMWGAREFLASGKPAAQAAAGWTEAVSRGFIRFRELCEPDAILRLSPQVGELLAGLVNVAKFSEESVGLLLAAGELPGEPDPWWREFTAGIWQAFQETGGARELLYEVSAESRSGRAAVARELAIAALHTANPIQRHAELDRVLDSLSPRERLHVFNDLIVRAANREAPPESILDYIAASRHTAVLSDSTKRLSLLVMGSLLLSNGHGRAVEEAAEQIGAAAAKHGNNGTGQVWPALLSGAHRHIADLRVQHAEQLDDQRLSYEAKLEEMRREQEGLMEQNKTFRALMASGREESRFEVRKDMLLEIGDILQRACRPGKSLEDRLGEVMARLPVALKEGGADTLGMVGDTALFEPVLHHSPVAISSGTMVRLLAPGVVVRSGDANGRVILKAEVTNQPEVI